MSQGVKYDIDDAHQTLKNTKAMMREVLAEIAAIQEKYEQSSDSKVSIV